MKMFGTWHYIQPSAFDDSFYSIYSQMCVHCTCDIHSLVKKKRRKTSKLSSSKLKLKMKRKCFVNKREKFTHEMEHEKDAQDRKVDNSRDTRLFK